MTRLAFLMTATLLISALPSAVYGAPDIMQGVEDPSPLATMIAKGYAAPQNTGAPEKTMTGPDAAPTLEAFLAHDPNWMQRISIFLEMPVKSQMSFLREKNPAIRWEHFARLPNEKNKEIAHLDLQEHINNPKAAVLYTQLVHDQFVDAKEIAKRAVLAEQKRTQRSPAQNRLFEGQNHVESMMPTHFGR